MMAAGTKTYDDPEIGIYTVRKSPRARRISLKVHPLKGVEVVLPSYVPYLVGVRFLQLKKGWVIQVLTRQRKMSGSVHVPDEEEIGALRKEAREKLPPRLAELASRYGFTYHRVAIKHNASNWGSCSSLGNINLNLNLVRLPEVLCDYVLLHELCHLRHHDHGEEFHLLLEKLCMDNVLIRANAADPEALRLLPLIRRSEARFPVHHVMTREIRKYRIV